MSLARRANTNPSLESVLVSDYLTRPQGVVIFSKQKSILYKNSAFEQLLGSSPVLPIDVLDQPGRHDEISLENPSGKKITFELLVRHLPDAIVTEWTDRTLKSQIEEELLQGHATLQEAYQELEKRTAELKAAQTLLVQAEKLAALGELSAGLAHELNQPLMGIRGYAQEVLSQVESGAAPSPEFLSKVVVLVDKMAAIIRHLRDFATGNPVPQSALNPKTAIDQALGLVHRQLEKRGIAIEIQYGHGENLVLANPIQLEQVFINLLTNARDAIESHPRFLKGLQGKISLKTWVQDESVVTELKDNGIGMTAEAQKKIFNPFFTTKEVGRGMGLGLSISYGILKRIHGTITVQSVPNQGTTFTLKIPAHQLNQKQEIK